MGNANQAHLRTLVLSMLDQAVASAARFGTVLLLARYSSKTELGLYSLGLTVALVLISVQDSVVSSPYTALGPHYSNSDRSFYAGSTLIHQLVLAGAAVALMWLAGKIAQEGVGPAGLEAVLGALAGAVSFVLLREFVRKLLFASMRMGFALSVDAGVAILLLGGILPLALQGRLTASRVFWVMAAACGVVLVPALWKLRTSLAISRVRVAPDFRRSWAFGRWILVGNLALALSSHLYLWLLSVHHGPAAAGVLTACVAVVSIGNQALMGFQNFFAPRTAHTYAEKGQPALTGLVLRNAAGLGAMALVALLALVLFGRNALSFLYGKDYEAYGAIVSVLAINFVMSALTVSVGYGLWATGRTGVNAAINLGLLGCTVTIGAYLTVVYGAIGAAVGMMIGTSLATAARFVAFLSDW